MLSPMLYRTLEAADRARLAGEWQLALTGYQQVLHHLPEQPAIHHNIALCFLALGEVTAAVESSRYAYARVVDQWQIGLIHAKALIAARQQGEAVAVLQQIHQRWPEVAEIRLELAAQTLHQLGDAAAARELIAPLQRSDTHSRDVELTALITQLYDPDKYPNHSLNQKFKDFSAHYLQLTPEGSQGAAVLTTPTTRRLRIGLLSPQFFVSPVYFFTIGILQQLAGVADLYFFVRGEKQDWATQAFQSIATEWVNVVSLEPSQLADHLRRYRLDLLLDLGGWMDPYALQALSLRPVAKQYKWVGGQSITTGLLATFDGFITDDWQTPKGSDELYSEPLLRLKTGYVTYTPPPYLPTPIVSPTESTTRPRQLGIIANPAKLSRHFLSDLLQRCQTWVTETSDLRPFQLHFIDKRYQQEQLQRRIKGVLAQAGVELRFTAPRSHLEYLQTVAQLDAMIDTYPYSGGLTTMEALILGVPCYTVGGLLFCERHTVAHLYYAGLQPLDFNLNDLRDLATLPTRTGLSLLSLLSYRMNSIAVADELFRVFNIHSS